MEIKVLTEREELDILAADSALTIEGLAEESIPDFVSWVKELSPLKRENVYVINGATMNKVYMLTGTNAYPDDLTIVAIKLEDIQDIAPIIVSRFEIGARWFNDVVANNVARERR